jgi:hypothetical protein
MRYYKPSLQTNYVEVGITGFEKEAAEYGITNLTHFYDSKNFKARYKIVDKKILCPLNF